MHKYFAQLKNLTLYRFETFGLNTIYLFLEPNMFIYFDLYIIQDDLGYDNYQDKFDDIHCCVGNYYLGCGENGFYNGDGNNYSNDLSWDIKDYA